MILELIASGLPDSIVGEARLDTARAILTKLREDDRDPDSLYEENVAGAVRIGTQRNRLTALESQYESALRTTIVHEQQIEALKTQLRVADRIVDSLRDLLTGTVPDVVHLKAMVAEAEDLGLGSDHATDEAPIGDEGSTGVEGGQAPVG